MPSRAEPAPVAPTDPTWALRPCAPALREDLACLSAPWLRDIAWLLHAPDMARLGVAGRPTLDELGLADDAFRRRWLASLAPRRQAFLQHLDQRRSQRLGIYHEALWQWILGEAPRSALLGHNLTLREGKRITGELDLLYRYRGVEPATIEHAELAIKFFLGLEQGPGDRHAAARWIGTGSFDSLAIKCHRLAQRQLPAARDEPGQAVRETLTPGAALHQRIIMPGFLYHPWHQRLALPDLANPDVYQGLWCHHRAWPALCAALPTATRGQVLRKPHWLAPPRGAGPPMVALGELLERHFAATPSPLHLRLTLPDGRGCRLFVVTDGWPPALPLPPLDAPSAR
ncbi:DUF1853 family protein [Salinicola endophyticus]|uniref:DUF1853 family protein n=1 Tax=Salinicola endophyticus TaxID=1949083 RepID=A0ABY8FI59_9GAMM|nr:DUF1853 family protein [Salinicola endophyticus]WFF42498.1 DUF1853 family protein [Salinicola endophyticus]